MAFSKPLHEEDRAVFDWENFLFEDDTHDDPFVFATAAGEFDWAEFLFAEEEAQQEGEPGSKRPRRPNKHRDRAQVSPPACA